MGIVNYINHKLAYIDTSIKTNDIVNIFLASLHLKN